MRTVECPYCMAQIAEPEDCDIPDLRYEHECSNCGKTFQFTIDYTKDFWPVKADCLNDKPHDYQPILHGAPDWYFKDLLRCSMCQKEIRLAPAIAPPIESYLNHWIKD